MILIDTNILARYLLDVFRISSVLVENYQAVINALRFLDEVDGLSFVDCYHLALAENMGMAQLYSFDKKMNRFPGVERIEPELPTEAE